MSDERQRGGENFGGGESREITLPEALDRIITSFPPSDLARRELLALRSEIAEQEETVGEARQMIEKLEEVIKKVTSPANRIGTYLGSPARDTAQIVVGGADYYCNVDPRISLAKLQKGTRVLVTLVQPMKPDSVVSGVVVLSVDGDVDGKPGRADFATLSGGKRHEIPFTFRYLENIEEEITMPPGMKPEQLLVEVRSNKRGSTPVQQSYVWSVDPQ
jgi:hypothetical protein